LAIAGIEVRRFIRYAGTCLTFLSTSSESWCGATLANGASLSLPSPQCNMKCSGNSNAICGGPNALMIFVSTRALATTLSSHLTSVQVILPRGWNAASSTCVLKGTPGRALAGALLFDNSMTIGKCIAFCATKGMQWVGIEYSTECYCGNDMVNVGSPSRTGGCEMPCPGQPGSICGGPGIFSLYKDSTLVYGLTQIGA